MHYEPLAGALPNTVTRDTRTIVSERISTSFNAARHGDLPRLVQHLDELGALGAKHFALDRGTIEVGSRKECSREELERIEAALRQLGPWRKGPFVVFGIPIDAEWRCDMKWERVSPHLKSLSGRTVLDVGCGNGYYCLRMLGAGAARVVGIEPSARFVLQFEALRRLLPPLPASVLPLRLEDLPPGVDGFDTVFSMGVLYHRRSAAAHLADLHARLAPGGQLVLETLTLPDGSLDLLIPEGRYANMRNVWAIPSKRTLLAWVENAGFSQPELVVTAKTSSLEQRSTAWMPLHSLAQALNHGDESLTVEGYPAPRRSVVVAERR